MGGLITLFHQSVHYLFQLSASVEIPVKEHHYFIMI